MRLHVRRLTTPLSFPGPGAAGPGFTSPQARLLRTTPRITALCSQCADYRHTAATNTATPHPTDAPLLQLRRQPPLPAQRY